MTNPVAPPPAGHGFGPESGPQYGGVPQQGGPQYAGPQYAGPQYAGSPHDPGAPAAVPVPEQPRKGRGLAKRIGSIVVAIVIALGVFAVKSYLRRDPTADAKVGDCIATDTKVADTEKTADATMAKCGSADAKFSIVGRVENETDTDSKSCDQYFTEEKAEYAVYASTGGDGYLLCLKKV